MKMIAHWEQTLWDDLERMSLDEQIIVTGEWITYITRELLTELGRHRRLAILRALDVDHVDTGVLADRLGSRRSTIERLAGEGRALVREEAVA